MADTTKFAVALLLLGTAIGLFYYFGDQYVLFRALGVLIAAGISLVIMAKTARGQAALSFVGETRTEFRKVVWPTRQETVRTTFIVLLMVMVMAIILWLFDALLLWAVRLLTGQGG